MTNKQTEPKLSKGQNFYNYCDTLAMPIKALFLIQFAINCARRQRRGFPKWPKLVCGVHDGSDLYATYRPLRSVGIPAHLWSNQWVAPDQMISQWYVPGAQYGQALGVLQSHDSGEMWKGWGAEPKPRSVQDVLQRIASGKGR